MSGAAELIRIAKAEVGYKEGRSNGHWNNKEKYAAQVPTLAWVSDGGYPWCAVFVSWAALKSGNADLFPRTASCATALTWFRAKGRFSEYPAIGAQVLYGPNGGTHTGIVYAYDSTYVYTVEGNTNANGSPEGDGVYLKKHARRNAYVFGYGLPKFSEGVTTADPKLKGKSGFVYAAKASGPAAKHAAPKPAGLKKVVVKSGMTLSSIAVAAGVTLAALLTANPNIKNPDVIQPGQTINVPAKPSPAPTTKATPKPAPKPSVTKPTCK